MIILVVPKEMEKRKRNGEKANHRMIKPYTTKYKFY